jgi:RimJ/RimL family protein N-acetyltransferase
MAIEAFPPLRTPRLCLRRFRACDAAPLAAYRSVPEVARYQGWEAPYSIEEAQMFVTTMATASLNMPGQWIQIAVPSPVRVPSWATTLSLHWRTGHAPSRSDPPSRRARRVETQKD